MAPLPRLSFPASSPGRSRATLGCALSELRIERIRTRLNGSGHCEEQMKTVSAAVLVLSVCGFTSPLGAQWLGHPTPGIPRHGDGTPRLSSPAPRTADGKPDFSGVWAMDAGPSLFYIAGDLKPADIKPFALELVKQRTETFQRDDQGVRCLPEGPRFTHFPALPKKIVQTPALIVILSEDLSYRQIFLDGRELPRDPSPSFMGYSVGRWEGDTLVVETIGFKDSTWLDFAGHPHTEALRVVERYRRVNFGQMEIRETLHDPEIYSRPLNVQVRATLVPDTELLEYVCNENERDRPKLVGTMTRDMEAIKPVKVAPHVLSEYVGSYDFRWPENPTVPSIWPVTMANGELLLQGAPLTPLSETEFVWAGSNHLRFFKDAQGRVTHFEVVFVEGNLVGRKVSGGK